MSTERMVKPKSTAGMGVNPFWSGKKFGKCIKCVICFLALGVLESAMADVVDPNFATSTIVDTFHMYNADASELTAHYATYSDPDSVNPDYFFTTQELIDMAPRNVFPNNIRYGSSGLAVRDSSSTQTIANWSMSTGGYGAGDYILRLGGVLSTDTTRQMHIYLLGETTREIYYLDGGNKTGVVDIAFSLSSGDISDGMIAIKIVGSVAEGITAYEAAYIDGPTYAGSTANGGAGAILAYTVPEPATVGCLLFGGMVALIRRHHGNK